MNERDSSVNILIKAPNQTVLDQTIECCLSWTIKDLKQHLAEVYPSKPHPGGQKLIYCGCLLPDNAVLSEVLRTYDGQQNNTIHLVCSNSYEEFHGSNSKMDKKEKHTHSAPNNVPLQSLRNDSISFVAGSHSEFRRRTSPYMNLTNTAIPNNYDDPRYMYQQMVWMQQAYMHYISHYMQLASSVTNIVTPQERVPENQQDNPAIDPNRVIEEDGEEEGHVHRDWLDWFYIITRVAVLFSVVYFYSSPVRCIMVTIMAFILYHLGMLRWQRIQNNNNNNIHNNRIEAQEDIHEENIENQIDVQAVQDFQYPNWITVGWTFLSSFFVSLIPEQREA